jgi:hypothetical protein
MGEKNCAHCAKIFETIRINQHLYCSATCRDKARRERATPERIIQLKIANEKWLMSKQDYMREYHLKRKFGISQEQYDELLEKQGGGCAICGKLPEKEGRKLAVDHCHKPPYAIRGILCFFCNHKIIGRQTDPEIFRKAADYLSQDTGLYAPKKNKKARTPRKERQSRGKSASNVGKRRLVPGPVG